MGDREQLIQAILNIARNALEILTQHPPADTAPTITMRTRALRQFTIGHKRHRLACRVDIIDNGPGIPKELQQNISLPHDQRARGWHRPGARHYPEHRGAASGPGGMREQARPYALYHFPAAGVFRMTENATVWIIDDDRSIRWVLDRALSQAGMTTVSFESGEGVLARLETEVPDAIISDIRMPGIDGISLLKSIGQDYPDVPVIIMTAHSDLDSAVSSYQTGAFEYLPKPFDVDEALELLRRAIEHSRERRSTSRAANVEARGENAEIIGEAPAMQGVFRAIGRLSHSI